MFLDKTKSNLAARYQKKKAKNLVEEAYASIFAAKHFHYIYTWKFVDIY